MYENRFNRTRYGDPLVITKEWKGVPSGVDAYTQVILWDAELYRWKIKTYFFKGRLALLSFPILHLNTLTDQGRDG